MLQSSLLRLGVYSRGHKERALCVSPISFSLLTPTSLMYTGQYTECTHILWAQTCLQLCKHRACSVFHIISALPASEPVCDDCAKDETNTARCKLKHIYRWVSICVQRRQPNIKLCKKSLMCRWHFDLNSYHNWLFLNKSADTCQWLSMQAINIWGMSLSAATKDVLFAAFCNLND